MHTKLMFEVGWHGYLGEYFNEHKAEHKLNGQFLSLHQILLEVVGEGKDKE